jgi:hypothetical protein
VKIAFNAADGHAFMPHDLVVGTKQKVHCLSTPAELGAIETAQRTATDDRNFHYKKVSS